MHKTVKLILILFSLVGAILWFMLPDRDMPASEAVQNTPMSLMFLVTYLLLAIAVVVSIFYTLKKLFSSPENLKKALFGVGALLLIVAISYGLASGTDIDLGKMADKGIITTEGTVRTIGMGINVFSILVIIAVGSMILPSVKKMFSK